MTACVNCAKPIDKKPGLWYHTETNSVFCLGIRAGGPVAEPPSDWTTS